MPEPKPLTPISTSLHSSHTRPIHARAQKDFLLETMSWGPEKEQTAGVEKRIKKVVGGSSVMGQACSVSQQHAHSPLAGERDRCQSDGQGVPKPPKGLPGWGHL